MILSVPYTLAEEVNLIVQSIPSSADVQVNGVSRGQTPLLMKVQVNSFFKLRLEYSGMEPFEVDYQVEAGERLYVDLRSSQELDQKEFRKRQQEFASQNTSTGASSQDRMKPEIVSVTSPYPLPEQLLSNTLQGSALYRINVGTKGEIFSADALKSSSLPELDRFISSWIKQWVIEPAFDKGFPMVSFLDLEITYDLTAAKLDVPGYNVPGYEPPPEPVEETADELTESADMVEYVQVDTATPEPALTPTPEPADAVDCDDVTKKPEAFQPPKFKSIPIEIQNLNLKGEAKFAILIDTDGSVKDVDIIQSTGNDELDAWLVPGIKSSYWIPGELNGTAVACWRDLTLSFYTLACKFNFTDLYSN